MNVVIPGMRQHTGNRCAYAPRPDNSDFLHSVPSKAAISNGYSIKNY